MSNVQTLFRTSASFFVIVSLLIPHTFVGAAEEMVVNESVVDPVVIIHEPGNEPVVVEPVVTELAENIAVDVKQTEVSASTNDVREDVIGVDPTPAGNTQCSDNLDNEFSEFDINNDGSINLDDFSILAAHFGEAPVGESTKADYNGNGTIDADDYEMLKLVFGFQVGDGAIDEKDSGCKINGVYNADLDNEYGSNLDEEVPNEPQQCVIPSPNQSFDFDNDGFINLNDFSILAASYGQSSNSPRAEDVNNDGVVDGIDYYLFKTHFGETIVPETPDTTSPGCTTSETPDNGGGSNNNNGGGGRSRSGSSSNTDINGEVLGASTAACAPFLTTYLRAGAQNSDVTKLQSFLNEQMGSNLPLTGMFGPMTEKAVNEFQLAHKTAVLAPWVAFGLPNENTTTGYVYKTTTHAINSLFCPGIPMPLLP